MRTLTGAPPPPPPPCPSSCRAKTIVDGLHAESKAQRCSCNRRRCFASAVRRPSLAAGLELDLAVEPRFLERVVALQHGSGQLADLLPHRLVLALGVSGAFAFTQYWERRIEPVAHRAPDCPTARASVRGAGRRRDAAAWGGGGGSEAQGAAHLWQYIGRIVSSWCSRLGLFGDV